MKKLKVLSLFALATIFASCSSDNINGGNVVTPSEPDGETTNLTFTGNIEGSKTFMEGTKLYWLTTDALGIFAIEGETFPTSAPSAAAQFKASFSKYTSAPSKLRADFYAPNTVLPGSGKYNYCIVYPYEANAEWTENSHFSAGYGVRAAQTQSVINRNADVISENGYTITRVDGKWRTDSDIQIGKLYPQVAYIELNLSALATNYGGKKVTNITLASFKLASEAGVNPSIAGNFDIDWSKYNATTGMRAVTNITNASNSVKLTTSNFTIPSSTADSAMAYMVVLPMSEQMDHYKVTINMADGTIYQAKGGESKNLQLVAGKKYKLTLPALPNIDTDPIGLEYQDVYLYWGNDDCATGSTTGVSNDIIDVRGVDYTFNLNTTTALYNDMYLRLPIGMTWAGSSSNVAQAGGATTPYIIKLSQGVATDIKVTMKPSVRINDASLLAYSSLSDAISGSDANVKQRISVIWNNRPGYLAQDITDVPFTSVVGSYNYLTNASETPAWCSASTSKFTLTKNNHVRLLITDVTTTPLDNTREIIYVVDNAGKKAKVFIQQNELAMSLSPIRVDVANKRYTLDNTGTPVVFGFNSVVGRQIYTWWNNNRTYWTPNANGTVSAATGAWQRWDQLYVPNTYATRFTGQKADPCSYVYPRYSWRLPTDLEAFGPNGNNGIMHSIVVNERGTDDELFVNMTIDGVLFEHVQIFGFYVHYDYSGGGCPYSYLVNKDGYGNIFRRWAIMIGSTGRYWACGPGDQQYSTFTSFPVVTEGGFTFRKTLQHVDQTGEQYQAHCYMCVRN